MTHRVGAKGQIVIPKDLRERHALTPGSEVAFGDRPDGVIVKPQRANPELRGRYRHSGLAKQLLEDRAKEPG